jgi:hypothetical protein
VADALVPELEEAVRDEDGAVAVDVGAVDDHLRRPVGDAPRRALVDPLRRQVDRAREPRARVRHRRQGVHEHEAVASLELREQLLALDVDDRPGHEGDSRLGPWPGASSPPSSAATRSRRG